MISIIVRMKIMVIIVLHEGAVESKSWASKRSRPSENQQAIIDTASRVLRERGVDGIGVADVMKEAGTTHGGFYNHFKSKDGLAAAACSSAFAKGAAHLKRAIEAVTAVTAGSSDALEKFAKSYLHPSHFAAQAGRRADPDESRWHGIDMLATLVGTFTLARGVGGGDPQLAEEIMAAGRQHFPE